MVLRPSTQKKRPLKQGLFFAWNPSLSRPTAIPVLDFPSRLRYTYKKGGCEVLGKAVLTRPAI